MTRNYTYYNYSKPNLELFKNEKVKLGEIYTSEIDNQKYYMVDVEIIKPEINREKIKDLIHQLEVELQLE